jgi:hypothetical protein
MLITKEWLKNKEACKNGYEFVVKHNMIGLEHDVFIKKLMDAKKNDWANWVITRFMNKTQCVEYSVFSAEQVISICEEKYPEDKRPRNAIQAAKNWLKNNNSANVAAASAAYAAASAAYASAAYAASASAAYASASAAAANAAAAAADAAYYAAYYAAKAAYSASAIYTKIINYGLEFLKNK